MNAVTWKDTGPDAPYGSVRVRITLSPARSYRSMARSPTRWDCCAGGCDNSRYYRFRRADLGWHSREGSSSCRLTSFPLTSHRGEGVAVLAYSEGKSRPFRLKNERESLAFARIAEANHIEIYSRLFDKPQFLSICEPKPEPANSGRWRPRPLGLIPRAEALRALTRSIAAALCSDFCFKLNRTWRRSALMSDKCHEQTCRG